MSAPISRQESGGSLEELAAAAGEQFAARYGRPPRWIVAAPGRVNLIGEHTDYNGGFVLPMAINRYVVIAADRPHGGSEIEQRSVSLQTTLQPQSARFRMDAKLTPGEPAWSNYVRGPLAGCLARGLDPGGFDALIHSNVPPGGGCSSSAALEVATATLVEAITGRTLDPLEKAVLCQTAEHTFAGVPCGIMDMAVSILAQRDHLLLLDCRSRAYEQVPLSDPGITVLVANTNVKHELTDGGYGRRREECFAAAAALGVPQLRDATLEQLDAARDRMAEVVYRRGRHVIGEIARTREAVAAMKRGDWPTVGRLMYESHASLRDDFEVSCEELDIMVNVARRLALDGSVIGSRMTGGGFGGCTVSLVRTEAVGRIVKALHEGYASATGVEPTIFSSRPAAGALVIH